MEAWHDKQSFSFDKEQTLPVVYAPEADELEGESHGKEVVHKASLSAILLVQTALNNLLYIIISPSPNYFPVMISTLPFPKRLMLFSNQIHSHFLGTIIPIISR